MGMAEEKKKQVVIVAKKVAYTLLSFIYEPLYKFSYSSWDDYLVELLSPEYPLSLHRMKAYKSSKEKSSN